MLTKVYSYNFHNIRHAVETREPKSNERAREQGVIFYLSYVVCFVALATSVLLTKVPVLLSATI